MFDRMIECEPAGARNKSRRKYFMVSTLAVGTLALSAVVFSIFAEELSLGTDNFDLSVMIMPVEPPATQPEPPRPKTPATHIPAAAPAEITRRIDMARVDEPTIVPKTTSTAANTELSRPTYERYKVTGRDSGNGVPTGVERNGASGPSGPGSGLAAALPVADSTPDVEPPPVKAPPRVPPVVTRGVINGQAVSLPKPNYPATAIAVRAQGKVDVQVLIDENGKVISAKAVSGNPLFRDAAERAARIARFTPTKLSDVPVKVTGVIVYNFNLG